MSKKNVAMVEETIRETEENVAAYGECVTAIAMAQDAVDMSAETIAKYLYRVKRKKLYMLDAAGGYSEKSFLQWAVDTFGFSKGTVSDSVNTYERFANADGSALQLTYQGYKFSTLMRMKKLETEDIQLLGITEEMTRSEVNALVDKLPEMRAREADRREYNKRNSEYADKLLKNGLDSKTLSSVMKKLVPEATGRLDVDYDTAKNMNEAYELINSYLASTGDKKITVEKLKDFDADRKAQEEYAAKEDEAAKADEIGALKEETAKAYAKAIERGKKAVEEERSPQVQSLMDEVGRLNKKNAELKDYLETCKEIIEHYTGENFDLTYARYLESKILPAAKAE